MDLPELHAEALDHTRKWVAGIKSNQWHDATPCSEWDVREVVNHIVGENLWVPDMVAGKSIEEVGDVYDGDMLGDDPLAAYDQSAKLAADAFRVPGAMENPVKVSYGPVPGRVYTEHRLIDVVIHGWDVAKATGQDTTIPAQFVDALVPKVELEVDAFEASGYFGKRVKVSDQAEAQTRLLGMLGRQA